MSKEKKDELKKKLENVDDLHDKSQIMHILPPPNINTQENLEDPSGGQNNEMFEVTM